MQPMLTHVAGVDVHKDILVITTLIGPLDQTPEAQIFECSTFTPDLVQMGKKLLAMGIEHVVMESTGVYWKPIYNVWSALGLIVTIGNAAHIKNVPGRKTDTKDSEWLAQLHRCGLIRPSFIPDTEFQQLRLLNRHRTNLTEDLTRVKNRVQKVLEDGNMKWSSMVSDVFCPAGMALLDALAQGITETSSLVSRVKKAGVSRLKRKEDLTKALSNGFREDHCFLIRELMRQYVDVSERIQSVEKELEQRLKEHADLIQRLDEIPGIDTITAQGIVAEATTQMENFKDERAFAAWAGVAPGNRESAGKKKEPEPATETRPYENS